MKNEEKVKVMAYYIWQNEGCPHGRDHDHWMKAMEMCGSTGKSAKMEKSSIKTTAKKAASAMMKAKPAMKVPSKKMAVKAPTKKSTPKKK